MLRTLGFLNFNKCPSKEYLSKFFDLKKIQNTFFSIIQLIFFRINRRTTQVILSIVYIYIYEGNIGVDFVGMIAFVTLPYDTKNTRKIVLEPYTKESNDHTLTILPIYII